MNTLVLTTLSFITGHLTSKYVPQIECFGKTLVDSICRVIYEYETQTELKEIGKGTYALAYHYRGKEYKVFLRFRRGPKQISMIVDENEDDVTDAVTPFLGPDEQAHGQHLTPHDLGYEELTLVRLDDTFITFKSEDAIHL